MTPPTSNYIVAYGFQDKFELTEDEAKALIQAAEQGAKICKFKDRVFSTNFTWLVPKDETKEIDLDSRELALCEDVAEWLARDVNGMEWSEEQALRYSKKLMQRIGYSEVMDLWNEYANGAYPSVAKFLMEAKDTSAIEDEPIGNLLGERI